MRLALTVNGRERIAETAPARRLADLLRDEFGLTGTKIGCNAGDCGACTVLLDGAQICACLVSAAQAAGRSIVTVEGLAEAGALGALQAAFLRHGAAQCGICTPGMLMAAADLLARTPNPDETAVRDALGGVLCRCTGYRKIIEAVLDVASADSAPAPAIGAAVGARVGKVDGAAKLTGSERFGADTAPADALWLRAVRSPHARARFTLGSLAPLHARYPGLARVLTAADIPGSNRFGIYPTGKDQPALAEGEVRFRGEAVLALVGDAATIAAITDDALPIAWEPLPPITGIDAALAPGAPALHPEKPDNVLITGRLVRGDVEAAIADAAVVVEGAYRTGFVEHAYIEPEAGYASRIGDRIEIFACTQTPYMDRDELALILGVRADQVRIVPSAVGGGFGGKLDLSLAAAHRHRRLAAPSPGALRLHAPGIHGVHNQAPSRDDPRAHCGRCRGAAHRGRFPRRFQHRRLCLLGSDGGEPRAGACQRALSRAECPRHHPRHPHQRDACRRLSRLRRAAGGGGDRDAA